MNRLPICPVLLVKIDSKRKTIKYLFLQRRPTIVPLGKARGSESCLFPLQGSGRFYIAVMDKREQIVLLVRKETLIEISFVIILSISTWSAR